MNDLQRTDEWFAARCGKATASRIADVMAKTKTGWGAGRKNYMAELVAERLTGTCANSYVNAAMQHGIDTEPDAIAAYEFFADRTVTPVGSVDHPTIAMSSASPDGLVGDDGLIEVKCPATATHIDTLLGGSVPRKYILQMQWQMACTGRAWCDFVSFDPRMPESMKLFIKRVERNESLLVEVEKAVTEFLDELSETVANLRTTYEDAA